MLFRGLHNCKDAKKNDIIGPLLSLVLSENEASTPGTERGHRKTNDVPKGKLALLS